MSIQLEKDGKGNYFLHDFIDGWHTAKITKGQYYYIKKHGIKVDKKWELIRKYEKNRK